MDIFKIIFTISLYIELIMAFIAFDCSKKTTSVKEISLVDTLPCTLHKKNMSSTSIDIQIIQPKVFEESEYYSCLIEIKHLIFRCGKTIDTFHKKAIKTELYDLDKTQCKNLVDTGYFYYEDIKIKINKNMNVNYISAETYGKIIDGTCYPGSYEYPLIINGDTYDRAVRSSEFKIIIKKSKGTIDIDEDSFILDTGTRCKYSTFSCFSANEGNIYWDNNFKNKACSSKEYIPIFEGQSTKIIEYYKNSYQVSYIIHYNDYDFQLVSINKISRLCGSNAILTEHPNLAILEKDQNYEFNLKYDTNKIGKNINLMTYMNSKLVYMMKHTKDQIDDLYTKISYDKCLTETRISRNLHTIATQFPNLFAYEFYGKSGYTAVNRGEVIYIFKCSPVSVNFTITQQDTCYNEIPVIYDTKLYFMQPRTRILTNVGTLIDCSSVLNNKYKFSDNWFTVTPGGLIPSTTPDTLRIFDDSNWEFKKLDKLIETGIYSISELDKINKIILSPIQINPITVNIQRSMSGKGKLPNGMSVTNMITEEEFKNIISKTVDSTWSKITSGFQTFGNFVSGMVGFIIIIKIIKFLLNMIINSLLLYKGLGCNWKLAFFWWENLVHHFLREKNELDKRNGNNKKGDGSTISKEREQFELICS